MNRGLISALGAVATAQALKIPMHYAMTKKWDFTKLIGSGGMPSSHSSGVAALAAYTGVKYGFRSNIFAVTAMLGAIVMYDAMNVRRHAGETAIQVNDLDEDVEKLAGLHPDVDHRRREKKLKENLGHMPAEVAAGAVLGAAIGAVGALSNK